MSKIGTVTDRGNSPKGKPTIHIDNQLYYAGNTPLAGLTKGDKIEFDCTSFGDRGDLWSINKGWRLVEGASKYPPQGQTSVPVASPERPSAAVEASQAISQACLNFASNCVGSAIRSGAITEPDQIEKWLSAARASHQGQFK